MFIKLEIVIKYVVWSIIVFGRFEGYTASKYPKVVKPVLNWHLVAAGSSFYARCISESPIIWKKRGSDRVLERYRPIGQQYYGAILELDDIQTRDVGYYDCLPINKSEPAGNASFYLYVDDPARLIVGPRIVRSSSVSNEPAVVPCRPTALDITVKLLTSTRDPMPFSLDPSVENRKIYFDPRRGFILPAHIMTESLYIYICEFSKRGVRQDVNVELYVGNGFVWNYANMDYKPNGKIEIAIVEGATVKFVAEVFTNFNPTITWYNNGNHIIVSGNKYKIEQKVGESWETSLTIRDVDESDIGFYTVSSSPTDLLTFRLDVGAPRYLKLEIPRVFMKNDEHFTAFCYGNYSKVYTDVSWTFRPHDCSPNQDCEELIEPFFLYQEDGHMMNLFGAAMQKPMLGNLTCSILYLNGGTERVTEQVVISEVGDGFGIVEVSQKHGTTVVVCIVSRYLYSSDVYWIAPNGFVIENNTTTKSRNITLMRSENRYSYKLELRVQDYSRASNGGYRCMAVDHNYTPSFKTYSLYTTAEVPPKIVKTNLRNRTMYIEANANLKFTCGATGSPKPAVYWFKDDELILLYAQNYLVLNDVKFKDSLRYGCEAFNRYGSSYVFTDLVVYHKVEFTIAHDYLWEEKPLVVQVSKTIALYCHADGQPNIRWFKDGKKLEPTSRVSILEDASLLVIVPVELEDIGLYSCKTKNGAGPWAIAITVEYQPDEKRDPEGWVISGPIQDVSVLSTFDSYNDNKDME